MTKEEAIKVLKSNYPSSCYTMLREAVDMAIKALSQPSLPSDLDEAAEAFIEKRYNETHEVNLDDEVAFKAGAEWMAGQGYTKEGIARPDDCEIWVNFTNTDIKDGDKVIVQIRKK